LADKPQGRFLLRKIAGDACRLDPGNRSDAMEYLLQYRAPLCRTAAVIVVNLDGSRPAWLKS
jgi:hypothetical protein